MKAYNKRLNHTTKVGSIDFISGKAYLLQPDSNPKFYYSEHTSNIDILDFTGVTLDEEKIYVGDEVVDHSGERYKVKKLPGGYYPFMTPTNKNFTKAR